MVTASMIHNKTLYFLYPTRNICSRVMMMYKLFGIKNMITILTCRLTLHSDPHPTDRNQPFLFLFHLRNEEMCVNTAVRHLWRGCLGESLGRSPQKACCHVSGRATRTIESTCVWHTVLRKINIPKFTGGWQTIIAHIVLFYCAFPLNYQYTRETQKPVLAISPLHF